MAQNLAVDVSMGEEEIRCVEEDLVKSFFPSLFDSDSDSDDVYCLQSLHSADTDGPISLLAQSSPQSSAASAKITSDLLSPITKANSTSLLHLSRRQEALPESGSPLSQENSSHTVFQPGPLEHSHSIGDQSPFHSVLSLTSSSSVFDADSREELPLKKRKVEWTAGQVGETLGPVAPLENPQTLRSTASLPAGSHKQGVTSLANQGSITRPLCLAGGITTGVPVDSLAVPRTLPMSRAASSHVAAPISTAWPAQTHALPAGHHISQGQLLGHWRTPQAMIPTTSVGLPCPQPAVPAKQIAVSGDSSEKIATALAQMSKAPLGVAPLGLKLDKVGVMHQLTAMGMRVTGM